MDLTLFKSSVFLTKFGYKLLLSLSAQTNYVLGKIIARTLCFMHQGIFKHNYIFNNEIVIVDAQKINFQCDRTGSTKIIPPYTLKGRFLSL